MEHVFHYILHTSDKTPWKHST